MNLENNIKKKKNKRKCSKLTEKHQCKKTTTKTSKRKLGLLEVKKK